MNGIKRSSTALRSCAQSPLSTIDSLGHCAQKKGKKKKLTHIPHFLSATRWRGDRHLYNQEGINWPRVASVANDFNNTEMEGEQSYRKEGVERKEERETESVPEGLNGRSTRNNGLED